VYATPTFSQILTPTFCTVPLPKTPHRLWALLRCRTKN
jgi:hypothetical protein